MKEITAVKKERKQKKSFLDPYRNKIKYYHDLGVTVPNIAKIMNDIIPLPLSEQTYRKFIKTRL